ncbi:MAG: hypothetical protein IKZ98_10225 [Clostridia bacterium]|nr:hypothetical protein [Clostridia bacterium]
MKRFFAIVVALCIMFIGTLAFADLHDDLENMTVEELESVIQEATQILEQKRTSEPEEKSADGVESIDEGSKELSDEIFMADLSKALVSRWDVADSKTNQETSIMSDKQYREHLLNCVSAELVYLNKYADYDFTDSKLGGYAQTYLQGVQNQYIAVSEYYGISDNLYAEYYDDGYRARAKGIYLINKTYGLDIPSSHSHWLLDFVTRGQVYEYMDSVEALLTKEMANKDLKFETERQRVELKPFNINNDSALAIPGLSMQVHFVKDDIEVEYQYLVSYSDLNPEKSVSTRAATTYDYFDSLFYTYSYHLEMNGFYDTIEGKILPVVQYSWDGKVKKAGKLAEGQPEYGIENITTGWENHATWSKTLYVPTVKFNIKNIGTGNAREIAVKCVFIEGDGNKVWDEEVAYVVGSSDKPLEPGYSKQAFVYSSVGYRVPVTLPDLTAEIYINDQLVEIVQIAK